MGQSLAIPRVIPNDWKRLDLIVNKIKFNLGRDSSPTFTGFTLSDLTASRIVGTNSDKKLVSLASPLIVTEGGTGAATFTDGGILLGSGTGAITALGMASNGQIPIGDNDTDPVLATITGTSNQIIIVNGAGSITLSTPQDMHTGASPTLAGLTLTGDMLFSGAGSGLAFGEINVVGNSTETTITSQNVYVQVTIFDTNGENNNVTPDHTEDHITITKAGRYFISCSITLNSISGSGSTAEIEVKKNNGNARVGSLHVDRTLSGGGTESGAITITGIVNLAVDDTIEVWIKNETNTQNYVVEDITLSLIQIGGT